MKTKTILFIVALCAAIVPGTSDVSAADRLFLDGGEGFFFSNNSEAGLVRYQHDTSTILGWESYWEAVAATWNGPDHNSAFGLARGVIWQLAGRHSVHLAAGLSHINRTTNNLGQPFEFYGRLSYEAWTGPLLFSAGWMHLSDGRFLFQWSGPNKSENFITLSLGVRF